MIRWLKLLGTSSFVSLLRRKRQERWTRAAASNTSRFRHFCQSLPEMTAHPFFVKVGANDGVTGDPCSDILLASSRWKGLLIEPVPYCFNLLKRNFGDPARFSLEQVAIGAKMGEASFYSLGPVNE